MAFLIPERDEFLLLYDLNKSKNSDFSFSSVHSIRILQYKILQFEVVMFPAARV